MNWGEKKECLTKNGEIIQRDAGKTEAIVSQPKRRTREQMSHLKYG